MRFIKLLGTLAVTVVLGTAQAGVITQSLHNNNFQIQAFFPIGQSFTAEDSSVAIGFEFVAMNPSFGNDPLTMRLLSGDGTGGSLLASQTFTLSANGFFDVDFSSVALSVGQVYTAVLEALNPRWGVYVQHREDVYAGGRAYFADINGFFGTGADSDLTFRVTPTDSGGTVPEPTSLAIVAAALGALATTRRRRNV